MLKSTKFIMIPNYYQKKDFELHKWGKESCCIVTCFHSKDYNRMYYARPARKPAQQTPEPDIVILYLN